MKFALSILAIVLLAMPVLAQQGDFLRSINSYGTTYKPIVVEDLRLPEPVNYTMPLFGNYSYNEILAAKVVSGEYYSMMADYFRNDLAKPGINVTDTINNRSSMICNVTSGRPTKQKDRDCMKFFGEMGLRSYELSVVASYDLCRGNTASDLNTILDAQKSGTLTDIGAVAQYSILATALKWCQAEFGMPFTVLPPTAENTKPSMGDSWAAEPVQPNPDFTDSLTDTSSTASDYSWVWYAAIAVLICVVGAFFILRKPKSGPPAGEAF
jgi:hypothetical protein